MSFPDFPGDMESEFTNYLGEDLTTLSSNEKPTASAPVDSLEESSYDSSGRFTWDEFFKAEGIQMYSPPNIDWEWNANEGNFFGDEIGPPPTAYEASSEGPAQSSRREDEAPINFESDNANEQPIATASQPELHPEENIPDDDSLFGEENSEDIESLVLNTGDHSNGEAVAAESQLLNPSKQEQKIDIPDDDSLFSGSTSNERHQSEVVAQDANSNPELVADTPQHSDSATSAKITPDADLNNVNADTDNDSLFGDIDDSGLGEGVQIPKEKSSKSDYNLPEAVPEQAVDNTLADTPSDDVDDLFNSEFGVDFEGELEAELKKDSANAVAPAVAKHTGLHLPKPPRKVAKPRGLHLSDPPRKVANPQGLHLPEPPRKPVGSQGLRLPDPPRVVANSQEPKIPVPPRVPTNPQEVNLPDSPPATVFQQGGVDTSAQEQTDDQEEPAPTRHRRVRASRIPRSDMSRPKGREKAGKVLTQLSGPAPSKLPEAAPSSSSGADDVAEKPTRLPRWAFGKYGSFGKPVAGSRYRRVNSSANNPIPVGDGEESVDKTNEVISENQNVAQPAPEVPDAIDLTDDTEDHLALEVTVQSNQILSHTNGQVSTRAYENLHSPTYGDEQEFTHDGGNLLNSPELNFAPIVIGANPIPNLQASESQTSSAMHELPTAGHQYEVPPRPIMEESSPYGQAPLASSYNCHQAQVPNVHGAGTFVYQPTNAMGQTGTQSYQPIPQPIQTGNYERNRYVLGGGMSRDMSANEGDSTSSGANDNRPKKRPSHERAEYGDPRVLLAYSEFKQIFPQEPTRGCFEVAIQNERAADAAIVARGGVPPQRPTIRKAIICSWSQVQHLNRIRAANGEKLFELKPKAHKRPAAFKESMRGKRQERGETSESEEFDMEPEPKRLRLAQEPMQMAPSLGERYGERTSQIRSIQPDNRQKSADVSHPPSNHGVLQGLYSQNMGQATSMQIHQLVAQSFKRKIAPEQLESFESMEQEMRPKAKRPRIALQMSNNTEPTNNQSLAKEFQDYVSQRQSEYLKLRVPELRQLCSTREVQHNRANQLSKGGLVGVLVGQDVSRHPVYSQMHNQTRAGVRHPVSNVGGMGGMDPPPVPVNRGPQQSRAPNGWRMRQDPSRPDFGPVYGMGGNYHQQLPPKFPPTAGHSAHGPIAMGNGNNAQPSRNVGRAQQPLMNASIREMANNSGQSLVNDRQPPITFQPSHRFMTSQDRGNLHTQSRLPVSGYSNGDNNIGIQQNPNGGRNNQSNTSAQVPTHGIHGSFGDRIYRPAVDDRRRKPKIQGQDVPSSIPLGSQRNIPQAAMNLPQPAMDNAARRCVSYQQPIVGATSRNLHGGQQVDTRGVSQIPRPVNRGNMGTNPQRYVQNHPQGGPHPAPRQGLPQGAHQQYAAAPGFPPPYLGRAPGNPFNGQPPVPAPPG